MEFFFLISQMRSFSINQRNLFISGVMKRPCESFINQDFSVYLMSVVRLTTRHVSSLEICDRCYVAERGRSH